MKQSVQTFQTIYKMGLVTVVGLIFSACTADYKLVTADKPAGDTPPAVEGCNCDNQHPLPTDPPPNPNTDGASSSSGGCTHGGPQQPPLPEVNKCEHKIIVKVKEISVRRMNGPAKIVKVESGEVDLCELSHDYFGVIKSKLHAEWDDNDHFLRADLILDDRSNSNRVEDVHGVKLCNLRIPPGATAGIRFEPVGTTGIDVETRHQVQFEMDETEALHKVGTGDCQLQHPIGHFDLFELK